MWKASDKETERPSETLDIEKEEWIGKRGGEHKNMAREHSKRRNS